MEAWIGELRPRGVVERALAERACRAAWKLGQCDQYEDAAAFRRDRDAPARLEREAKKRIESIGRTLIAGPPAEADEDRGDRRGRSDRPRIEPEAESDEPATLLAELKETAEGVDWLMARWDELGGALKGPDGGWDEAAERAVAGLLGLRPESLGGHPLGPVIRPPLPPGHFPPEEILGHPATPGVLLAISAARSRGEPDAGAMFSRYVASMTRRGRVEAAAPVLGRRKALVRSERQAGAAEVARPVPPRRRRPGRGVVLRDVRRRQGAVPSRAPYSTAASRDLHRCLSDLTKIRRSPEDRGDDPEPVAPSPLPGGPPSPSPGPIAPDDAPRNDVPILRNEAKSAATREAGARSAVPGARCGPCPGQPGGREAGVSRRSSSPTVSPRGGRPRRTCLAPRSSAFAGSAVAAGVPARLRTGICPGGQGRPPPPGSRRSTL